MFSPMGRKGFVSFWRGGLGMEMRNSAPSSDNEAFCPPAAVIPLRREPAPGGCVPPASGIALHRTWVCVWLFSRPLLPPGHPAVRALPSLRCGTVMAFSSELRGFGLK